MRFFVFIFAVVPLAGGTIVAAAQGNPFAVGIVLGAGLFFSGVLLLLAAHGAEQSAPRKADPATIARLERELGIVESPPPREGALRWDGGELWAWLNGEWRRAEANVVDTEAPTTVGTFHVAQERRRRRR